MKRIVTALILTIAIMGVVAGIPAFAASYKSPDGSVAISASTIDFGTSKITARGNVHLTADDNTAKTHLVADANKMVVEFTPASSKKVGAQMVKSAELTGPVKMIYITKGTSDQVVKTTANADNATYSGTDQMAHLNGNVKITQDDPAVFAQPAVLTGEKASVNLKPGLGPDDVRFRIETPDGTSKIEATPKEKASQAK